MDLPIVVASDFVVVAEDLGEIEDRGFNAWSVVDRENLEYRIECGTRRRESMEEGVVRVDCLSNSIELLALFRLSDVAWTYYNSPLDALDTLVIAERSHRR